MRGIIYSPRLSHELTSFVTIKILGAGFFSISFGRILAYFIAKFLLVGLFEVAFITALLLFSILVWVLRKGGFLPLYAAGMAFGCAVVCFVGVTDVRVSTPLNLWQVVLLLVGGLLMFRSFSEGPEPNGWTKESISS